MLVYCTVSKNTIQILSLEIISHPCRADNEKPRVLCVCVCVCVCMLSSQAFCTISKMTAMGGGAAALRLH